MVAKLHQDFDDKSETKRFGGLHLSGPNAGRTALVVLSADRNALELKLFGQIAKISNRAPLASDDRIVFLLDQWGPLEELFVDAPISQPPCVRCVRPVCPGRTECDDVAVAYMESLALRVNGRKQKRGRPFNPQSQRLWDIWQWDQNSDQVFEPSFNPSRMPLSHRATALQKRMNFEELNLTLKETCIATSLQQLAEPLGFSKSTLTRYRSFDDGRAVRLEFGQALVDSGWLLDGPELSVIFSNLDLFEAMLAAFVGFLHHMGLCDQAPAAIKDLEPWVFSPKLSSDIIR